MGEWWRGCVIYQIYPRSYQDANGDGVGDLPGITARLGHIAGLGVDAIWLSPIFTSPMDDMGYDVVDYTDVDPLFGTLADFDTLVETAHGLGLKVIIDQVLNHTSDRHAWFTESRASRTNARSDWYVWVDPKPDGAPPNNWTSYFGGPAWEWDSRRRQYYLHHFLPSQPDLNFHNPAVQEAVLEAMRFWLDRGVDGFRLDTVNFYYHDLELRSNPPKERNDTQPTVNPIEMQHEIYSKNQPENIGFLRRMRALVDGYSDRTLIGEVGETGPRAIEVMSEYTRGQDRLHMAYSFEMLSGSYTRRHFQNGVEAFFRGAPDGWPCWSLSNHDVTRHVTRWGASARDPDALARQCAALLLSLRGSACIYQGEELGLPEAELELAELTDPPGIRFWPEYKGRDGARTPMPWDGDAEFCGFSSTMPWLPIKAPHAARSVAAQDGDPTAPLAFYRAMLAYRHARRVLRDGAMQFFDTAEPVLAFVRDGDGDALVAVFNLSPEGKEVVAEGLGMAAGAPSQAAGLKGTTLTLGPNGFAFLDPTGARDRLQVRDPA